VTADATYARRVRADDIADPWEVHDPRFRSLQGDVRWTVPWEGGRWLEGPAWNPAARMLVFSDIPNNRLLRLDDTTGAVGVFRHPAGFPNGNTFDREGRLVTCEQGARRVVRTEHDASITVLADDYADKPLNSPNDVVVDHAGAIWFTDPPYGIGGHYEGLRAAEEQNGSFVYRVDPTDLSIERVAGGFERPTGIAFSPDEEWLYVADSRTSTITRFRRTGDTLADGETFVRGAAPSLDSMAIDEDGRIWIGALDGVHCYDADGSLLGKIRLPDAASHVAFGGTENNVLYACATTALCTYMLPVRGLAATEA
jgi:gluconolactonase